MRFVLANRHLILPGGTEVHLVTLGEQLVRLGHEVVLYAPELGPFADHARGRGLDVTDAVAALPPDADAVFAQDSVVAYELADSHPDALAVFRICGDSYDFQLPPLVEGVVDVVVVVSDRYARIARAAVPSVPLVRLHVPIDTERIVPLGPLSFEPKRAIVYGNYDDRFELVREVWGRHGVEVERVGGDEPAYDVARALADTDIVVAKSRAALDAMAAGRAVYVFDMFGGDGWVTPAAYPVLEADNFAGQATPRVIDEAALTADLAVYNPAMGGVNRDLAIQHHGARDHALALLEALEPHEPGRRPDAPSRELGRLVALQWSWEQAAREYRGMYRSLREHAARAEGLSADAARAAAAAELARERAERETERALHARERAEHETERALHALELAEVEKKRLYAEAQARADEAARLRAELDVVSRLEA